MLTSREGRRDAGLTPLQSLHVVGCDNEEEKRGEEGKEDIPEWMAALVENVRIGGRLRQGVFSSPS